MEPFESFQCCQNIVVEPSITLSWTFQSQFHNCHLVSRQHKTFKVGSVYSWRCLDNVVARRLLTFVRRLREKRKMDLINLFVKCTNIQRYTERETSVTGVCWMFLYWIACKCRGMHLSLRSFDLLIVSSGQYVQLAIVTDVIHPTRHINLAATCYNHLQLFTFLI